MRFYDYPNVEAFIVWPVARTDNDYRQIVFLGSLNRSEITKEYGIAKESLCLNPQVKILLEQLEKDMCNRGMPVSLKYAA